MRKLSIKDCIGKRQKANNGLMMTIIGGTSLADMIVRFDDGTIVEHKFHSAFKKGKIAHPTIKTTKRQSCPRLSRLGEQNISLEGEKVVIIAYRKCEDVDVQFEDGTILKHIKYSSFKNGKLKNPNFYKTHRVGETRVAHNGMKMTIIVYRTWHDIDIQFEDGVVVTHSNYGAFKTGKVVHPTVKVDMHIYKTGEETLASCGLKMKIVDYIDCQHLTVRFEDGYEIADRRYDAFQQGFIKHPFPFMINNIEIKQPAYIYNMEGNFYCKCNLCGQKDVMSLAEIKSHHC